MNGAKLVKKFLMPCGLCAVPVVAKKDPEKMSTEGSNLIRPSDLPIYSKEEIKPQQIRDEERPPSYLEQGFGTIRRSLQELVGHVSVYTDTISNTIDTGLAHSQGALDYLQEESNTLPRIGAIGIGGLTGYILGLRGGRFRRIFLGTTGALAIAAVCHPRQAQESWEAATHYSNILINFIYGVKPGDEKQPEIHWPSMYKFKMPTSISEVSDMAANAGSSIVSSFNALTGKATETTTEPKENKTASEETKKSK